jgi:arylsulfatase A-like enzyme
VTILRTLASALLLVVALPAVLPRAHAGTVGNILVVVADDYGVDVLETYEESGICSGAGQETCQEDGDCPGETCVADYPLTPTIDSLAATGLVFRNAWAAPVCSPARAAILTGRYGFRTGVTDVGGELPDIERTLPELLNPTYATAAFGKWHLGGGDLGPNDQGFSHYAGALGGGIGDYFSWPRTVNGQTDTCAVGSNGCPAVSYATSVNVNDTLAWLEDLSTTEPWFVWLSFNAPHTPYHVPPHELLEPATVATLPRVGGATAPEGTVCVGNFRRPCYLATVEAMDRELQRLIDGLPGPTTIIFIGDNGTPSAVTVAPFPDDHAKGSVYEGGLNVPLIITGEAVSSPSADVDALVSGADLFQTVLDLAGVAAPADRIMDSISLVPYLSDASLNLRSSVYGEIRSDRAVRDARFKLIRRDGGDEFYDLLLDPFEQNPLDIGLLESAQQASFDALSPALDDLVASCDALSVGCGAVVKLALDKLGAAEADLDWTSFEGAASYDVVRGDLEALRTGRGDFSIATEACVTDDTPDTNATDPGTPPSGQGDWYLIRTDVTPTYDSEGAMQMSTRDTEIDASGVSCSPVSR